MKFCTTPNSKNIIETLRIVTIEKSELTFLEFNRVFESLCACIFFKNSSIVLKKFLYLLYIRRKEYSLNSIKPPICEILNIFFLLWKINTREKFYLQGDIQFSSQNLFNTFYHTVLLYYSYHRIITHHILKIIFTLIFYLDT